MHRQTDPAGPDHHLFATPARGEAQRNQQERILDYLRTCSESQSTRQVCQALGPAASMDAVRMTLRRMRDAGAVRRSIRRERADHAFGGRRGRQLIAYWEVTDVR